MAGLEPTNPLYFGGQHLDCCAFNQFGYTDYKCYRQSSTIALYCDILQNIFYIFTQNSRCRESRRRNLIVQMDCYTTNLCQRESNQQLFHLLSSWCYHLPSLTTLTSRLVQAGVEPTLLRQVNIIRMLLHHARLSEPPDFCQALFLPMNICKPPISEHISCRHLVLPVRFELTLCAF